MGRCITQNLVKRGCHVFAVDLLQTALDETIQKAVCLVRFNWPSHIYTARKQIMSTRRCNIIPAITGRRVAHYSSGSRYWRLGAHSGGARAAGPRAPRELPRELRGRLPARALRQLGRGGHRQVRTGTVSALYSKKEMTILHDEWSKLCTVQYSFAFLMPYFLCQKHVPANSFCISNTYSTRRQ